MKIQHRLQGHFSLAFWEIVYTVMWLLMTRICSEKCIGICKHHRWYLHKPRCIPDATLRLWYRLFPLGCKPVQQVTTEYCRQLEHSRICVSKHNRKVTVKIQYCNLTGWPLYNAVCHWLEHHYAVHDCI